MEQRRQGTLEIWAEPFTALRVPKLFNLRMDPYERADITSNTYWYWDWYLSKAYMIMAAQAVVQPFLETFKDYRRGRRRRALRSTRPWRRWPSRSARVSSW